MTSTREVVLEVLLERQRVTISDLAEAVEINPISVRHHIGKLEAAGFVTSESERHGVGRPRQIYFLTEKGMDQFPSRNIHLASELISEMKKSLSKDRVDQIFRDMGSNLQSGEEGKLQEMSLDERLTWIKQKLTSEGFGVSIDRTPDEIFIYENGCPYYHVGQEHREVCIIDNEFINVALETKAKRITCMLDGDSRCTYVIPLADIQENKFSPAN